MSTDLHEQLLHETRDDTFQPGCLYATLEFDRYRAALRAVVELHSIIWRDIGWLDEERDEQYAELPVCVLCVPKHSHFGSRAEVPEGACETVQAIARELGIEAAP